MTKKEYGDLLDLLYIADWVLSATRVDDDPKTKKYKDIFQRIYSYAKDFGYEHMVEYIENRNEYVQDDDFKHRSSLHEFIDEYDNDSFWTELANRLIDRDLIRQLGSEKRFFELEVQERIELEYPIREKYEEEFYKNGLDNVKI